MNIIVLSLDDAGLYRSCLSSANSSQEPKLQHFNCHEKTVDLVHCAKKLRMSQP